MVTQGTHSPEREDKAPTEKKLPPSSPPQLRGPPAPGKKGRKRESSHSRVHAAQGIPRALAPTPLAVASASRRHSPCPNSKSRLDWKECFWSSSNTKTVKLCSGHPVLLSRVASSKA